MADAVVRMLSEPVTLEECEAVIAVGLGAFVEVGQALAHVRDDGLFKKAGFSSFEEYCHKRWDFKRTHAFELIQGAAIAEEIKTFAVANILPETERQVRPLARLKAPSERAEAWNDAVLAAQVEGVPVHARHVEEAVKRAMVISEKEMENTVLDHPVPEALVMAIVEPAVKRPANAPAFNRTNDNVEWAWWTWNPVTGCLHNCDYCYARDIANRYYPEKFAPTFHPERLCAPRYMKVPAAAASNVGAKNVFVCSMADLWGKWVPTGWIEAVLTEVRAAPQWNFLFLTKFPQRYEEFAGRLPRNAWMGTSVDRQHAVLRAEKAFKRLKNAGYEGIAWLSCEPMLEQLTFSSLSMFDWVVMGGASASTQTPKFLPPIEWTFHLWQQARAAGCIVYMKTNLGIDYSIRMREYPHAQPPDVLERSGTILP